MSTPPSARGDHCSIAARPILAVLRCACGSADIIAVAPGNEIDTLDDEIRVNAPVSGRCLRCAPELSLRNTAGSAHGAISPAASQHAGDGGARSRSVS